MMWDSSHRVMGNEIDVEVRTLELACELLGVRDSVIRLGQEYIIHGDPAIAGGSIASAGLENLGYGSDSTVRDEALPNGVGGCVKREGETPWRAFRDEAFYTTENPGGGDGDPSGAECASPIGLEDRESRKERGRIVQGFAHAHHDQVRERLIGRLQVEPGMKKLFDDLPDGEVADDSFQAAGTEGAPHRASDLSGDAEGHPFALGDEHRLDAISVGEIEKRFLGPVGAGSPSNDS